MDKCGTMETGYIQEAHPSVAGSTKNVTVCFDMGDLYPCNTKIPASITHCKVRFLHLSEKKLQRFVIILNEFSYKD